MNISRCLLQASAQMQQTLTEIGETAIEVCAENPVVVTCGVIGTGMVAHSLSRRSTDDESQPVHTEVGATEEESVDPAFKEYILSHVSEYNKRRVYAACQDHGVVPSADRKLYSEVIEDTLFRCSLASHFGAEIAREIEALMNISGGLNQTLSCGKTPLEQAFSQNVDKGVIIKLLELGADPNKKTYKRAGFLESALKTGQREILLKLIEKGANPNAFSDLYSSPLQYAIAAKDEEIAAALIRAKASVYHMDFNGYTPLHNACMQGLFNMVGLLLEHKADVNATGASSKTPLQLMCETGSLDMAIKLLDNGADPNAFFGAGQQPLELAVRKGCEKLALALLEKGALVTKCTDEGYEILNLAITKKFEGVALQILNQQVKLVRIHDLHKEQPSFAPFLDGSKRYFTEGVDYFIRKAIENGLETVAFKLLEKGAQILDLASKGTKLLDCAGRHGCEAFALKLMEKGVDPSSCEDGGKRLLRYAYRQVKTDLFLALLRMGITDSCFDCVIEAEGSET